LRIGQTKRNLAGLFIAALLGQFAWAQNTGDIAKEIAPTGTLRAVINLGNPILAKKDNTTGEPVGVSVDLAQALAKKFNLPLKLIPVESAAKSVEAVTGGDADLGFFAIDPVRGKGITFTPPYVLIEGSYLVKKDSPLVNTSQVDQSQHRVVVGKGSAYDLFLTRELKAAQLVRAPTSPMVVPLFLDGNYDVAAGVKQQLESDAQGFEGLRLLPGRFMVIEQAMGQPNGVSKTANDTLAKFLMEMKSNGFVRDSLSRHHIEGASIAP
jgi:polar amino acid transport system substrate-binding protein